MQVIERRGDLLEQVRQAIDVDRAVRVDLLPK